MAATKNQKESNLGDAEVKIPKKKISPSKENDLSSNLEANKSQKSNETVNPTLAQDLNLDYLISLLLLNSNETLDISEVVSKISVEDKQSAIEVFQITIEKDFEISEKLRINQISEESALAFSIRFGNLSFALKAYSEYENPKILKLIKDKCLSSLDEFNDFSKLASKQYLLPRLTLPVLAETLLTSTQFKKAELTVRIKAISFMSKYGIDPTRHLMGLENITKEFNNQSEEFQNQVIENFKRWHIHAMFQFLSHIDADRIKIAVANKIIADLQVSEIYDFSKWNNPEPNSSKAGIFKRIIRPAVENFLKWNNNIDDLLLLWPFLVNPDNDFNISEIRAKFKNSINKAGHIQESLRDGAVPMLQEKIERIQHELNASKIEAVEFAKKLASVSSLNDEINLELKDLRSYKLDNLRVTISGREAIDRQIRIDVLRELLPAFETALASSSRDEFASILEILRIEEVGKLGQRVRWNSQICESLTGEDIVEGIVARTGFTWFTGKDLVPLRRMLVKPE